MHTGKEDRNQQGQMNTWNNKNQSGYYEAECGHIKGSAGEFWPRSFVGKKTLDIFVPEMCRTLTLDYNGVVKVNGIRGHKYVGALRPIDNGTQYPENLCYCGGNCVPSGVLNVSSCAFGSPFFTSYPHFYLADHYFLRQVEGLNPSRKDHEFYIVVEPDTGAVIEATVRIQINMLVQPIQGFG